MQEDEKGRDSRALVTARASQGLAPRVARRAPRPATHWTHRCPSPYVLPTGRHPCCQGSWTMRSAEGATPQLLPLPRPQCLLSHRSLLPPRWDGWVAHSPSLGSSMGKQGREKIIQGETPPSTSPVLASATHPNLHCGCEMTIPLSGRAAVRQAIMPAFSPSYGESTDSAQATEVHVPGLLPPV